jgi:type I restriction enzyme S subunit
MQVVISEVLKSLDDRIALLRETNTTLEAIAQALFKSWFVDFDPVHAKAAGRAPEGMDEETAALFPDGFEESELRLIPRGWENSRVEALLELSYGKALKSSNRVPGRIPVYGSGGVTGYHNQALVNDPSIIVGRKGTVGSIFWEDEPFFPIDTVFYVKTKRSMAYCYYLLKTLSLNTMNTDAAVPGLNRNNVYRLLFAYGGAEIIQNFDKVVTPLRQKMFANLKHINTLGALRDILLPRLISGKLQLSASEINVESILK